MATSPFQPLAAPGSAAPQPALSQSPLERYRALQSARHMSTGPLMDRSLSGMALIASISEMRTGDAPLLIKT